MPPGDDIEPVNKLGRRQQLVKIKSRPLHCRCHHPSQLCRHHHHLPLCCLLSAVAHRHHNCAAIPPSRHPLRCNNQSPSRLRHRHCHLPSPLPAFIVIAIAIVLPFRRQLSCHRCCPMQSAAAVPVSLRDTHHRPSPPLSPITIMLLSRCPWRCCRCSPLQLRCYRATLRHLLMHCPPSTCRLVVTLGWLSSRHLSSHHHLSRHRLVVHVTS
jgi:hypothetical protein